MKITYILHSCFLVETDHYQLIFDYYDGEIPALNPLKKTVFFASHRHEDHFSSKIYEYDNAKFVLSRDIYNLPEANFLRVKPRQSVEYEGLKIETLKSTDEGVAFLVHADGLVIYHAGDLNWWYWPAENKQDEIDNALMEKRYKKELERLKGISIDAAFIPLDPRLEEGCCYGMKELLDNVDVQWAFPMHMWKQYSIIDKMVNTELSQYRDKIIRIKKENEVFEI